jgi:hypothetical protein
LLKRFRNTPPRIIFAIGGTGPDAAIFFVPWTTFDVWPLGDGSSSSRTAAGPRRCSADGVSFVNGG